MSPENSIPEYMAQKILLAAIKENRAAELLSCLFDGGSCTLDAVTLKLSLVSADQLEAMSRPARLESDG